MCVSDGNPPLSSVETPAWHTHVRQTTVTEVERLERLEVVLADDAEVVHQRGHALVADLAAVEVEPSQPRALAQRLSQRSHALLADDVTGRGPGVGGLILMVSYAVPAHARPRHARAPLLHAVHPLLASLIELVKLYKTRQK